MTAQFNIPLNLRLWWEKEGVFTKQQRDSLRQMSLARIICDNTGIAEVPKQPFQYQSRSNFTRCEDVPAFNLSAWREDIR